MRTQRKDALAAEAGNGSYHLCGPIHNSTHHEFGCCDSKGRTIGATIYTGQCEIVELPADKEVWSFMTLEPGIYYTFCPQATRAGKSFGACQSVQYFKTAAERDAKVAKYLAGAAKRAAKLATAE